MVRCFFHFFCSFLGRKPPCWVVRCVSEGRGGALQVSWVLSDICCIRWSSLMQDISHWLSDKCSFVSIVVSSFICREFSSKNTILSFSMFSCGMGFRILGCLFIFGCVGRASNVL